MSAEGVSPPAAAVSSNGADPLRMPDGALVAKRDAPVGGQAVLEGVMMRGVSTWAVAVRNPEGQIEIELGVAQALGAAPPPPGACRSSAASSPSPSR